MAKGGKRLAKKMAKNTTKKASEQVSRNASKSIKNIDIPSIKEISTPKVNINYGDNLLDAINKSRAADGLAPLTEKSIVAKGTGQGIENAFGQKSIGAPTVESVKRARQADQHIRNGMESFHKKMDEVDRSMGYIKNPLPSFTSREDRSRQLLNSMSNERTREFREIRQRNIAMRDGYVSSKTKAPVVTDDNLAEAIGRTREAMADARVMTPRTVDPNISSSTLLDDMTSKTSSMRGQREYNIRKKELEKQLKIQEGSKGMPQRKIASSTAPKADKVNITSPSGGNASAKNQDPKGNANNWVYKAASVGVGGGLVLSMANNRGQQSNSQLYGQGGY